MRLFKYCPFLRGEDILTNERIVFTPPGKFSDPFEMRINLSPVAKREFKRRLFEEVKEKAKRGLQGYSQLSPRQQRIGRKEQTRGVNIGAIADESFQAAIQRESQQFGILCLCTAEKSKLMWDHYTRGFQGFVIEFDSNDGEFKKLGALWKVEYVDKSPVFNYSKPIPEFFRFKPKCYEYEGEYRIVRPIHECTTGRGENDVELFFRPLPRACVKAVYLGHRMEKSAREGILKLLKQTEAKKFDVDPKLKDYELSFREII